MNQFDPEPLVWMELPEVSVVGAKGAETADLTFVYCTSHSVLTRKRR